MCECRSTNYSCLALSLPSTPVSVVKAGRKWWVKESKHWPAKLNTDPLHEGSKTELAALQTALWPFYTLTTIVYTDLHQEYSITFL